MVLGSRLAQRLFGDSSALGKEIIWHNEWIESPTGEIEPAPSGYVYTVIRSHGASGVLDHGEGGSRTGG